ncbi:hypothetical protein FQZ97_752380 [compost metagenome]
MRMAEAHDFRDLLRIARQRDAQGWALVPAPPIFGVAGQIGLGMEDGVCAQGLGQRVEQGDAVGHVCGPGWRSESRESQVHSGTAYDYLNCFSI